MANHLHDTGETTEGVWYNPAYKFTWTERHLPRTHTDPLRYEYDTLGRKALVVLQATKVRVKIEGNVTVSKDLCEMLKEHHQNSHILGEFWTEINFVPEWVDWAQIERAQKFFVSDIIELSSLQARISC